MLAEMGEKVEASAAVMMMYFFCRLEKVECRFCPWTSGVSSSDTGRTSVCVCFVDSFVDVDMMRLAKGFSLGSFVVNKSKGKKKTLSEVSGKMLLRLAIYHKILASISNQRQLGDNLNSTKKKSPDRHGGPR